MATVNSSGSGLASVVLTGYTDGDTLVIQSGRTVTWDLDLTGATTGYTVTINGMLEASTTPGSYGWKANGNVTGSGTLRVGTDASTPYPANCSFSINFNGARGFNSSTLVLRFYCTEPVHKFVRTTAAIGAGVSTVGIDTDLTGETSTWYAGASVLWVTPRGAATVALLTLQSLTSNSITFTTAPGARAKRSHLVLLSRNVRFYGNTTTALTNCPAPVLHAWFDGASNPSQNNVSPGAGTVIDGGVFTSYAIGQFMWGNPANIAVTDGVMAAYYFCGGAPASMAGGIWVNTGNGLYNSSDVVIDGGLWLGAPSTLWFRSLIRAGTFDGIANVIGPQNGQTDITISGGSFIDCGVVVNASISVTVSGGTFSAPNFTGTFAQSVRGLRVTDVDISALSTGFNLCTMVRARNVKFPATDIVAATGDMASGYEVSEDHNQVAGAFKAWTAKAGTVVSDTTTVFPGRTRSYKHACTTASFPTFKQEPYTIAPGDTLRATVYVRKDTSMTYLPRVRIVDRTTDPLNAVAGDTATYTALAETVMTNSINTWETLAISWTNTASTPREVLLRTLAKNASGNVYFDYEINRTGGSAAGIGSRFVVAAPG